MNNLQYKREDKYRICLRCKGKFPNTADFFYVDKSKGLDSKGIYALYPRCFVNKCQTKYKREQERQRVAKQQREREMKYGFNNTYKNYSQMIAIIGAKEEPYFATEEDMVYKAPSYKEILKEYEL
jgi:hypothetical protein